METFTPIAMKCTEEQFEAIRPKLIGLKITDMSPLSDYNYLVNNLWGELKLISNIPDHSKGSHNRKVYEEWNEETFLKACGIEVETLQEKEFDLSMCRIIVDDAEQSKKLQELAFKQGFRWGLVDKIVTNTHKRVLYFNSEDYRITFSSLDYDDSNFKTFHFTDVFKETLEQRLQKAEAEVKRLKEAIEDIEIKIGDWVIINEEELIFKANDYDIKYLDSKHKKIQDQELIIKLNELIK